MWWKSGKFAVVLAGLGACAQRHAPAIAVQNGDASSETADADDAPIDASGPAADWTDAMRRGSWNEAARAIDALPETERARPPLRYARARVALTQKDFARVVPLLDGLEAPLPLLADGIARKRALAELEVGPYDKAAAYFVSRPGSEAQLSASRAFERAGDAKAAILACDHAIAADDKSRTKEAEARSRRLRLGGGSASDEAADARWLAIHAPDLVEGRDASTTLAHLDPGHPLTQSEMIERGHTFAEAGRTDDAIAAIDASVRAPPPVVPILTRLRARAEALGRDRKRQLDASHAYDACVNAAGATDAEDNLHAARALSRADHDDEAILRYQGILARFPHTTFAEQASFLAARLELLHGRWAKAAAAFDAYDKSFPNGSSRKDTQRDRAIAHLMNGDAKGAQTMFERLADSDPTSGASDLAALAAYRQGDKAYASTRWTTVASEAPASWRGIIARAKLHELDLPLPHPDVPLAKSPQPAPPLTPHLPAPADFLASIGLDDEAETAIFPRENTITATAPARGLELTCATYGLLDVARRRAQLAIRVSRSLLTIPVDDTNRWAWSCVYPEPYAAIVDAEEKEAALPRGLIRAVMRQESEFFPEALSPARAVGLMQLLPETARVTAGDPKIDAQALTDPALNVHLGARYLHELLERFHGSAPLAVAAYNAGPEAVERWIARATGEPLDLFVEQIPYAETRAYVISVMSSFAAYRLLRGGEAEIPAISLSLTQ